MPSRFHRSFSLIPGIRINLSKSGLGASFGPRGLKYSIGPRGTRKTASIPGTGLSFIEQSSKKDQTMPTPDIDPETARKNKKSCLWLALILILIPIIIIAFALGGNGDGGGSTITPKSESFTPAAIATQPATPTLDLAGESTPLPTQTFNLFSSCSCSMDYNCSYFSTHSEAQACFESCGGSAINNWSGLDGNPTNGIACESLP